MSMMNLINDIGSDADLLTRSDAWLEHERRQITTEMDKLANELRPILAAQNIKSILQQENSVAVQEVVREKNGHINDVVIKLTTLPNAINILRRDNSQLGKSNMSAQCTTWQSDGYDVKLSSELAESR